MMPTLEQLATLNKFLLNLYSMKVAPEFVKFSQKDGKPQIFISVEPIHDIRMERWFIINWKGELDKDYGK